MTISEKEQYLVWTPLQTLLLEAWENEEGEEPSSLGGYTANEYDGEDWCPYDIFAANTHSAFTSLRRRHVQRWPPAMILANFMLLAKKWGVVEAMSSRFKSPFIYGCSVWEACNYYLQKAEPCRSDLQALRNSMSKI